jgi:hypothetical protein
VCITNILFYILYYEYYFILFLFFRPLLNTSVLNNEFFAQACLEWTHRLSEGEFTPENQQKMKMDNDREKSKLDPFKVSDYFFM